LIALVTSSDEIKLRAIWALLANGGLASELFDTAAGTLWPAIIPLRLMVADEDAASARRILREAGWREAKDGDWDLEPRRPAP
jgi:hypothetical protein